MGFIDNFKTNVSTVVDPLGIGRRVAGQAPEDMDDPIARGTQSQTPDYGVPDDSTISDSARETAENAANSIENAIPMEIKGIGLLVVAALFATAFGQLLNINVGGGA